MDRNSKSNYDGEFPPNIERVLYSDVEAFYRPPLFFYVNLVIKDTEQAKAITKSVLYKFFRPIIHKKDFEVFESRIFEEASLQAMSLLYGEQQKTFMYVMQKKKLERLLIKTFVLQYISCHQKKFSKYL